MDHAWASDLWLTSCQMEWKSTPLRQIPEHLWRLMWSDLDAYHQGLGFHIMFILLPGRLTWNLRIHPWKRNISFQTIIFMCYVNLRGCIIQEGKEDTTQQNKYPTINAPPNKFSTQKKNVLVPTKDIYISINFNIDKIQIEYLSRWWQLKHFSFSPRSLGKWSHLTHIFEMGWFNHQLVIEYPQNTHEHTHHHARIEKDPSTEVSCWCASIPSSCDKSSSSCLVAWFFHWKPMGLEKKIYTIHLSQM